MASFPVENNAVNRTAVCCGLCSKLKWKVKIMDILIFCCSLLRSGPNPGGGQSATKNSGYVGKGGGDSYNSPIKLRPGYRSSSHSPSNRGRQSPFFNRASNQTIDPTQSPIRLKFNKTRSPLCERTSSGKCDRPSCSNPPLKNDNKPRSPRKSQGILQISRSSSQLESLSLSPGTQLGVRQPCRGAAGCCREACCRLPGNENKVCDPLCPFHKEKSAGLVFLSTSENYLIFRTVPSSAVVH